MAYNSFVNACYDGDFDRARRLLSEGADPSERSWYGATGLHYACFRGALATVKTLIEDHHCEKDSKDDLWGCTPLHYACLEGHLEVARYLISEQHCNPQCVTNAGLTPLHFACRLRQLDVARYLILEQHCNPQCVNNDGETPLHLACQRGHLEVARYLISEQHCNPQCVGNDGKTPLHFACLENRANVVKFLLSLGSDPNQTSKDGSTPLGLTRDTNITRELLLRGANPTTVYHQQMRGDLLCEVSGPPPESAVKVFVVGDVGAGKSTLTAALKVDLSCDHRTSHLTQVSGVELKTAGIIPHEIVSKALGRLTLYDFAGHKEFYSCHDTLLRSSMTASSAAVFLLVADQTRSDKEFRTTFLYWLAFLANQCTSTGIKPHLIIIGSHADKVSSKEQKDKKAIVDYLASGPAFSGFYLAGFVAMDCRYSMSSSMSELCKCLAKSCESLRDSSKISFQSHCFLIYLLDKCRRLPAVSLGEIFSHIQQHSGEDEQKLLVRNGIPNTMSDLQHSCEELNKRDNLLFLKNPESLQNSWLVLDKEALLTHVTGSVFAPEGFKQHHHLASSTGLVPLSNLAIHFPEFDPNMLAHFLTHLEFCHEIRDSEVLKFLEADPSAQERHFFFPALIQVEVPSFVWETRERFPYHCGWLLQCSQAEQFFLPRFLHVLLLRLAFNFALSADTHEASSDLPALKRKCKVWKNGISWANRSGVEAVVEVVERRVTMMLRCLKGYEMACVHLRSAIIQKVVQAKIEFCPKVSVTESFIHPSDATQYPPKPVPELRLFSLAEVAITVASEEPCVLDAHGSPLPLEELLHFEPYADLGEHILQELFDEQNPKYETEVNHEFLYRIAEHLHHKRDKFVDLFKLLKKERARKEKKDAATELFITRLHEHIRNAPSGPTHELVRGFQLGSEGTYHCLRRELDQFSVFAGRNPLAFTET